MVVFVEIIGVGTGNDSTLGMTGGDLLWSSSAATGFHVGFFDEKTLNGVAASCNIAYGGTLGGFDGDVVLSVYSAELISALIAKTIDLIGKEFRVSICDDPDEYASRVRRYTGRVGTWSTRNEISIDIVCRPYTEFNKKVIPSVTVNEDMALGISDSSAIGKSVTETYGNVCDFPLTYIGTNGDSNALIASSDASVGDVTDSIAYHVGTLIDAGFTPDGIYIGKSLLQVFDIYQNGSEYIWVALSFNGEKLFNANAEASINNIRRLFVGSFFKCIYGTGKDSQFKILEAEWASHDTGDYTNETVWFQINTTDSSSLSRAGGYSATWNNNKSNKPSTHDYGLLNVTESRIKAPYDDKDRLSDVSYLEFSSIENVFIVSSKVTIEDSVLYGISSDGEIKKDLQIPSTSIEVVYESSVYSLIRINSSALIDDNDDSFSFLIMNPVETRFIENASLANKVYIANFGTEDSDGVLDYQQLTTQLDVVGTSDYTPSPTSDYIPPTASDNSFIIPITDSMDVVADKLYLSPNIKVRFQSSYPYAFSNYIQIFVRVSVVGEGNISVGEKVFNERVYFTSSEFIDDVTVEINPIGEYIQISSVFLRDYDNQSKTLYSKMIESLELSDIANIPKNRLRYLYVNCSFIVGGIPSFSLGPITHTVTKNINPFVFGTRNSIPKDSLFLRSTRINTYTVGSPVMMARAIAKENGIDTQDGTFATVNTIQRTLFDADISLFDGQFQPDDDSTIVNALSIIAKQSMTALYMTPFSVLAAKWFADDDMDTDVDYQFNGNKVVKGSMQITKPQNGYRFTDFVYFIKKNLRKTEETLYVNTNPSLLVNDFPVDGYNSIGNVFDSSGGWTLTKLSYSNGLFISVLASRSSTLAHPITIFTKGTTFKILSGTDELTAQLTAIAPNFNSPEGAFSVVLGMTILSGSYVTYPSSIDSLSVYSVQSDWKDYVSGTFITDHTTARNIWEHAQEARLALGAESTMPNGTTRMTNPVWGSDTRALMQWVLYTTVYCTREKTIIKFDTELNSDTANLWIMSYVEFAWGPYALYPIKGWIVDIQDNYAQGTVSITMLTSVSDSDVLILDEMALAPDLIVDESINTVTHDYDEGRLA